MSDIIRLLPDSVANQIAAGEVIQLLNVMRLRKSGKLLTCLLCIQWAFGERRLRPLLP